MTVRGHGTSVAKADVVRFSRSRNTVIGAAIGVGASAAAGGFLQKRLNNEARNGDRALAVSLAIGGGLGVNYQDQTCIPLSSSLDHPVSW